MLVIDTLLPRYYSLGDAVVGLFDLLALVVVDVLGGLKLGLFDGSWLAASYRNGI